MKNQRVLSKPDQLLSGIGQGLHTLFGSARASRPLPAQTPHTPLDDADRKRSAGYMRVNHVGEVCAQALYQSQALTASNPAVAESMRQAAAEEVDHLAWCETRLDELGAGKSLLNPVWYAGSFALGTVAGLAGDRWNLGFVAETERQVVEHLESHLSDLPASDQRSREVVEQMRQDEAKHAKAATAAGAADLPGPVRWIMRQTARVMTRTAYYV